MEKLNTPLGTISISIDDINIQYKAIKLENNQKVFPDIEGRYRIDVPYNTDNSEHIISCTVDNIIDSKVSHYFDSGEGFECETFHQGDTKLTIGIEYDDSCYHDDERVEDCEYDSVHLEDGIGYHILKTTKSNIFTFGIAWIDEFKDEDNLQTYFAADPTLYKDSH